MLYVDININIVEKKKQRKSTGYHHENNSEMDLGTLRGTQITF